MAKIPHEDSKDNSHYTPSPRLTTVKRRHNRAKDELSRMFHFITHTQLI